MINDKIKAISLFSGSGGMDLGFLKTRKIDVVLANDYNKSACESYKHNIGDHIIHGDIKDLKNLPEADLVIGGPPCQGFSTANPKRAFDDPRNLMFKEYARIIKEVEPKVFVLENVSGMMTMKGGDVFKLIKKELKSCGYNLYDKLLNAKDFGVPQSRRRVFIVGVRKDYKQKFKFPDPIIKDENYITVGETINTSIKEKDKNHSIGKLTELNQERLKHIPPGGSMRNVPEHLQNNSDLNRSMRRLHPDKPSHTIVHNNCDHYYHPTEERRITIREMARIQGYPDSYMFKGSKSEQSRQVGNSVPVDFGFAIAKEVMAFFEEIEND
jgi:DNA (cytosine-5)-methyltransferase 1